MPKRPRRCWTKFSSLIGILTALVLLSGCADDRALVERTLDARERALNAKDIDAYMLLFSPEYVAAEPGTDLRDQMTRKFAFYQSIFYESYSRKINFEGDAARVIQEYRLAVVDQNGKSQSIKGYDHFMLKRSGTWPFAKWLFYTGLDGEPPKPKQAAEEPAPATEATPNQGDAQ